MKNGTIAGVEAFNWEIEFSNPHAWVDYMELYGIVWICS